MKPRTVTHRAPLEQGGRTPCCDRPIFELPRTDRLTLNPAAATCRPTRPRIVHFERTPQ